MIQTENDNNFNETDNNFVENQKESKSTANIKVSRKPRKRLTISKSKDDVDVDKKTDTNIIQRQDFNTLAVDNSDKLPLKSEEVGKNVLEITGMDVKAD